MAVLEESIDSANVFESQVLHLADYIERHIDRNQYILHQVDDLNEKIVSISKTRIHDEIINLFMQMSRREEYWLDLSSSRLYSILLHSGPLRQIEIYENSISSIASLIRHIIDFRSRFTATHSTGVAESAVMLAKLFGLTDTEISQIEIAGHFHDLGKLIVPNSILKKQGELTKDEFAIIKQHTYFTYTVLNTIGGLDQIAEWAAFHHQKLDGSGYPFRVGERKLSTGSRIMAVADIFTAITENRPYRRGMERKKIKAVLLSNVENNALDRKIVNLLIENFEEILLQVKEKQFVSKELFEKKFLKLAETRA